MLHFNVYLSTSLYNPQGQLDYVGYPQSVKGDAGFGVRYRYNQFGYQTSVIARDASLSNPAASDIYWQANSRYDDVGYWEYYSLRNLFLYVVLALFAVLVPVYSTVEGHAYARDGLCSVANVVKLKPIFCI